MAPSTPCVLPRGERASLGSDPTPGWLAGGTQHSSTDGEGRGCRAPLPRDLSGPQSPRAVLRLAGPLRAGTAVGSVSRSPTSLLTAPGTPHTPQGPRAESSCGSGPRTDQVTVQPGSDPSWKAALQGWEHPWGGAARFWGVHGQQRKQAQGWPGPSSSQPQSQPAPTRRRQRWTGRRGQCSPAGRLSDHRVRRAREAARTAARRGGARTCCQAQPCQAPEARLLTALRQPPLGHFSQL